MARESSRSGSPPSGEVRAEGAEREVRQERRRACRSRARLEKRSPPPRCPQPRRRRSRCRRGPRSGGSTARIFFEVGGRPGRGRRPRRPSPPGRRELDVPPVETREILEQPNSAVRVQGEDRELRRPQPLEEVLAIVSRETRHDPVPPLEEAVLLLHRLHPLVHLGLPEVQHLLGADRAAPLERLLERQDPRVRHEEVLLEVAERLEERLDRRPRRA